MTDKFPEDSTKIHVATVQSLVKRTLQSDEPMPVGRYDCIVVDEAHRGYILDKEQTEGELQFRSQLDYVSAYRRILDHFDAVKLPLTATPALHTVDIFGEPVYRYTYRTAVIDGYLIDQDPPIQIVTRNAQDGVYLSEGEQVERLDPQGELINDTLADDQDFEVADFNRGLVIPAFNSAVCGELTKYLDPTGRQKRWCSASPTPMPIWWWTSCVRHLRKSTRSLSTTPLLRSLVMPIKTRRKCKA